MAASRPIDESAAGAAIAAAAFPAPSNEAPSTSAAAPKAPAFASACPAWLIGAFSIGFTNGLPIRGWLARAGKALARGLPTELARGLARGLAIPGAPKKPLAAANGDSMTPFKLALVAKLLLDDELELELDDELLDEAPPRPRPRPRAPAAADDKLDELDLTDCDELELAAAAAPLRPPRTEPITPAGLANKRLIGFSSSKPPRAWPCTSVGDGYPKLVANTSNTMPIFEVNALLTLCFLIMEKLYETILEQLYY